MNPRRRGLIPAAVVIALIASGAALAAVSQRGGRPTNSTQGTLEPVRYAASSPRLVRPDALQQPDQILNAIAARYGGSAIVQSALGPAPADWHATNQITGRVPERLRNGRWLWTTVAAPATGPPTVRAIWEANLVAGALRDELALAGVDGNLIGSLVSVQLSDGRTLSNVGGGMGYVALGQNFHDGGTALIEGQIRSRASDLGLGVRSVSVLRPLQAAPAVVVTTNDPRGFVDYADEIINTLFGGIATYEGEYLEGQDSSGATFFVQGSDFRSGVGQRWIRPDLDARLKARLH